VGRSTFVCVQATQPITAHRTTQYEQVKKETQPKYCWTRSVNLTYAIWVQQGEHYLVLLDSLNNYDSFSFSFWIGTVGDSLQFFIKKPTRNNYDSDSTGSSSLPLLPVRCSSSCTTRASAQQFAVEVLQLHLSFPEHEADLPVMNYERWWNVLMSENN
jgi:hypothetical protein